MSLSSKLVDFITVLGTDIKNLLTNKQDKLESGTNIKTINGQTVLGEGNIVLATDGTKLYSSATAPTNSVENDLWFNIETGTIFVYYNSGGNLVWVDTGSTGGDASVDWTNIVGKPSVFNSKPHEHNLADIKQLQDHLDNLQSELDDRMKKDAGVLTVGQDFNTVTESGNYTITDDHLNWPTDTVQWGRLVVFRGADTIIQTATGITSPVSHSRVGYRIGLIDTVWSAWETAGVSATAFNNLNTQFNALKNSYEEYKGLDVVRKAFFGYNYGVIESFLQKPDFRSNFDILITRPEEIEQIKDFGYFSNFLNIEAVRDIVKYNEYMVSLMIEDPNFANSILYNEYTITSFLASTVALSTVINSQEALNKIENMSTSLSLAPAYYAYKNATGLPASRTEVMTSYNTPSTGKVTASSEYSSTYAAYHAFNDTTSYWITQTSEMSNQWIAYEFDTPRFVHTVELTFGTYGGPTSLRIEYSNDGSTWSIAHTESGISPSSDARMDIGIFIPGKYKHWRLFSMTNTSYGSIKRLDFVGFK